MTAHSAHALEACTLLCVKFKHPQSGDVWVPQVKQIPDKYQSVMEGVLGLTAKAVDCMLCTHAGNLHSAVSSCMVHALKWECLGGR